MPMNEAIALPHLANIAGSYWLEDGSSAEAFGPALRSLGYEVEARELNSGLHGIEFTVDGVEGAAKAPHLATDQTATSQSASVVMKAPMETNETRSWMRSDIALFLS